MLDAVVIGSGPNGLAAALALAEAGRSVRVLEARAEPGGGARSAELTLPGFVHDMCSTVHPLARASPFFRRFPLEAAGLTWCESEAPLAHVLDEHQVVLQERSIDATAKQFGPDGGRYVDLMSPLVDSFERLIDMFLGPLRFPSQLGTFARFGCSALRSMNGLAKRFRDPGVRALLGGMAAHAMLPLSAPATASFALVLGMAGHAVGWPVARGGTRALTQALVTTLESLGGEVYVGQEVLSTADLPPARVYLFDVTPRQLLAIAPDWLSPGYRRRLGRYRYGPGVFKMDWALREPVPWRDPRCRRATTVHLAGTLEEMDAAETAVHQGRIPPLPFVLFVQPTVADASRAPTGQHVGWAYMHVPSASNEDLTTLIEGRIERFAPGFRDVILARHVRTATEMEMYNPNYVGGDINGGSAQLSQLLFRPVLRANPYRTSNRRIFVCSSSTPPGGGVHGLCGYWAARSALLELGSRS
jgi:phytoene dehydrogenase-like protein